MIDEEILEIRQMFLDEAQAYVDIMDDGLVGIDPQSSGFTQQMDMILHALQSLQGAAEIMEYEELSNSARRLEASLQIIKSEQSLIIPTELLLLNAVGLLREIITINRQGKTVDHTWFKTNNLNIFLPLETHLHISQNHSVENISEPELDLATVMFEQEINGMLGDLELKLAIPYLDSANLREELQNLAVELADLGEMLELSNFGQLNRAIAQQVQAISSDHLPEFAVLALKVWRRSQAMVFKGKKGDIPTTFNFQLSNWDEFELEQLHIDDLDNLFLFDDQEYENPDQHISLDGEEELEVSLLSFGVTFAEEENLSDLGNFGSLTEAEELELDALLSLGHAEDFIEPIDLLLTNEQINQELIAELDSNLIEFIDLEERQLSINSEESSDNPFMQLEEIATVLESFNPFAELQNELKEDNEDIFSRDTELLVELEDFLEPISQITPQRSESPQLALTANQISNPLGLTQAQINYIDVILSNFKEIGAEIHTQTKLGVGTTFTIAFPCKTNIMRITLIEVNQMILGIPTNSIQEVLPYRNHIPIDQNAPIYYQNSLISIFPLSTHLHFKSQGDRYLEPKSELKKPLYATKSILILNQGQTGIYVDGCWGEQEVTLSTTANTAQTIGEIPEIFAGYAIATHGQSVPILNMQILT